MTRRMLSLLLAYGLMGMLSSSGVQAAEHSGGHSNSQSSAPPLKSPPTPTDFVSAEACVMCHQAEVRGLGSNPHAKLALEHGGKGVTCEEYRGSGKAHVESGDESSLSLTANKDRPRTRKDPREGWRPAVDRWIQERA